MTDRVEPASWFVCRCEEVPVDDVRRAIAQGASTVNDVKRRTTVGIGLCQGVFCVPAITAMIAAAAGAEAAPAVAPMTTRPPVRPIPLEVLADLGDADEA